MKRTVKAFIVISLFFLLRLITSCCNCTDITYRFSYVDVIVNNINNSSQWSRPSNENQMYAEGVAFEVQIVGCSIESSSVKKRSLASFKTLSAQSCDCDDIYASVHEISSIRIFTLEKINSKYNAGDDVTDVFLANTCINCDDVGSFYISIDELLTRINGQPLYDKPENRFLVYLKEKVEYDTAQFEFEISLSDGQVITARSELILIIGNE